MSGTEVASYTLCLLGAGVSLVSSWTDNVPLALFALACVIVAFILHYRDRKGRA